MQTDSARSPENFHSRSCSRYRNSDEWSVAHKCPTNRAMPNYIFKFILNWRIIVLQCCVAFCLMIRSSYSIHKSPPSGTSLPAAPHPSSSSRAPSWAPCDIQRLPTSYCTYGNVHASVLLCLNSWAINVIPNTLQQPEEFFKIAIKSSY